MNTKQHGLRTYSLRKNDNKSIPIGTMAVVRIYMEKLGFAPLLHSLKQRGEPLFPLVCALISYRLTENFSVEGCGRWLESEELRQALGLRREVSHRMLNRAIDRVGGECRSCWRSCGIPC